MNEWIKKIFDTTGKEVVTSAPSLRVQVDLAAIRKALTANDPILLAQQSQNIIFQIVHGGPLYLVELLLETAAPLAGVNEDIYLLANQTVLEKAIAGGSAQRMAKNNLMARVDSLSAKNPIRTANLIEAIAPKLSRDDPDAQRLRALWLTLIEGMAEQNHPAVTPFLLRHIEGEANCFRHKSMEVLLKHLRTIASRDEDALTLIAQVLRYQKPEDLYAERLTEAYGISYARKTVKEEERAQKLPSLSMHLVEFAGCPAFVSALLPVWKKQWEEMAGKSWYAALDILVAAGKRAARNASAQAVVKKMGESVSEVLLREENKILAVQKAQALRLKARTSSPVLQDEVDLFLMKQPENVVRAFPVQEAQGLVQNILSRAHEMQKNQPLAIDFWNKAIDRLAEKDFIETRRGLVLSRKKGDERVESLIDNKIKMLNAQYGEAFFPTKTAVAEFISKRRTGADEPRLS